jgi:polyisoprenoid-binding protein YceI
MKFLVYFSAFLILSALSYNEISKWSLDTAHSRLGFTITHMGITDVHGEFSKFDVKLNCPNSDFTNSEIELKAESNSINTGIPMRDDHLKGSDFFDVEKHPALTFKSKTVKKLKASTYTVIGDLTMHGITKNVTLTAINTGNVKGKNNEEISGLKIIGVIKRSDFKIGEPGSGLSDEVNLIADLELAKD